MVGMKGSLVIVDLGTVQVKYLWNGVELQGIVKIRVQQDKRLIMIVSDINLVPKDELMAYGIILGEVK